MSEEREEWSDTQQTVQTECDVCHERRRCARLPDPVASELRPDEPHESQYWCRECYVERGYDI